MPVTVERVRGVDRFARSAGGLVSGLGPLHEGGDGLWVGSYSSEINESARRQLATKRMVPVELTSREARRHYEGYSNGVLWPLFHYLPNIVRFEKQDFNAYLSVNQRFAEVIVKNARPGDRIWVHDYHLMLLPSLIREKLPEAQIGFFLHIPFPSSEVFRLLPRGKDLLKGLLGADLIGVHTYSYARHLVTSFRRLLGVEFDERWVAIDESRSRVAAFPLGVNAGALAETARKREVDRRFRSWRRQMRERKVILGVDRLDYTKGLPLRFEAYRRLLEMEPKWREKVQLMQLAVPSRSSISSYQDLKQEVERKVGEINGAFATQSNVPIRYMYRSISPEELAALYRLADVALVTPIRDGMNLVAKEYIASRVNDSGVLVLSEFAGAAWELGEAILVNPWDVEGTARAVDRALQMGQEEQATRMAALRQRVADNDVHQWCRSFLAALEDTAKDKVDAISSEKAPEWTAQLRSSFARSRRPLIGLDYDGTLAALAPDPKSAAPDPEILVLLAALAAIPQAEVVLFSGRDPETLKEWFGSSGVNLVANHGLYLFSREKGAWRDLIPVVKSDWAQAVRPVMEDYAARTPGAFVEGEKVSLAWHYRRAESELGTRHARELTHHLTEALARSPLTVLHGSKVVVVRQQGLQKGAAYRAVVRELGPFDFTLSAGDDRTDEELFRALPAGAWSIKVGPGTTHARFRLEDPEDLRAVLRKLQGVRRNPVSQVEEKLSSGSVEAASPKAEVVTPLRPSVLNPGHSEKL